MFFNKNNNLKIYIFIAICMIVIIGMWLYTLKLNLSKPSKSTFDWSEIFGGWGDAVKDVPPMPSLNTTTLEVSDELINELAEELKNTDKKINTNNWQIYKNIEYGFEFKYPKEFDIDKNNLGFLNLKLVQGNNVVPINSISVKIENNLENLQALDWILQAENYPKKNLEEIDNKANNNKKTILQKEYNEGGEGLRYFMFHNDLVFVVNTFFPAAFTGLMKVIMKVIFYILQ